MTINQIKELKNNSRFYVILLSLCLSAFIFFLLQIVIVDERARNIRLQQIYGLAGVLYWYVVLLMSAFTKVAGKKTWLPAVLFTRRAIGFMVAVFALLHTLIAYFTQLGGLRGITLLPFSFQVSIVFGFIALVVLLFMACLSVDKIVVFSKFKYWKVLSRVSYVAGVLTILHVWISGTHLTSVLIQFAAFQALVLLFGLESWRLEKNFETNGRNRTSSLIISISLWLLLCAGLISMKLYVSSYNKSHQIERIYSGASNHAH